MLSHIHKIFILSAFSIVSGALFAEPNFKCVNEGGRRYIEVVDSSSVRNYIYMISEVQCKAEVARLEEAKADRSHLPLEVCGCEVGHLPAIRAGMGRTTATLYCYKIDSEGKITWERKFYESSLGGGSINKCELARTGQLHKPPDNKF